MNGINPCLVCRQKQQSVKLMQLQRLQTLFRGTSLTVSKRAKRLYWNWDIQERCRYGMFCPELKRQEIAARQLVDTVETYFAALIEEQDDALYHQTLEMLRGHFPRVYRELERQYQRA